MAFSAATLTKRQRLEEGNSHQYSLDAMILWLARSSLQEICLPRGVPQHLSWSSENIFCVRDMDKLPQVLRKLEAENLSGAPVLDAQKRFAGMVSSLDIIVYMMDQFETLGTGDSFFNFVDKKNAIRAASIKSVIGSSNDDLLNRQVFLSDFPVLYAIEKLIKANAHRVASVDRMGHICGLFTESMTLSLLAQNMDKVAGVIKHAKVSSWIRQSSIKVLQIEESRPVIDAFRLVSINKVTAVAVTRDGVLVNSIGVRDIKGIGINLHDLDALTATVKQFKTMVCGKHNSQLTCKLHHVDPNFNYHAVTVDAEDTTETVIRKMHDHAVHNIWLVNADKHPIHCISQRDILEFILLSLGTIEPTILL
jgi:CBS-domain-containing membrane protein